MNKDISKTFTPFFVADRQASLQIIRGLEIPDGKKIGIMTHANTTNNFKNVMAQFPCSEKDYCEVIKKECPYKKDIKKCEEGKKFTEKVIKISDSGVFTKEGCMFEDYSKLFEEYEKMNVNYGIIIDYLKDKEKTVESAKSALKTYKSKDWTFKLIGVAQGNTVDEYVECYQTLKNLGFQYLAIGGLLEKKENTVRYVKIRDETLLHDVLKKIRDKDPESWLFALGSYAPSRHNLFLDIGIQGSDYKGWIFQYKKQNPDAKKGDLEARSSRYRQVRFFIENKIVTKNQDFGKWPKLLVIPCSKKKLASEGMLPAIERYQGQYFKILKKYVTDFSNNNGFDIAILSAKYGLLEPMDNIEYYNLKMDAIQAQSLKGSILKKLAKMNELKQYREVVINLGSHYIEAIEGYEKIFDNAVEFKFFEGRIGERQKQMKDWLEENKPLKSN
ncbi:MAG: peroxide stress protein YaaA [Euryarchaeota archaeon]|nr:peroxide stress protein YaaA [Euryarchaeota archaeon]